MFIKECTLSYGKVKLVLKHNRYFVESTNPEAMQAILKDRVIQQTRLVQQEEEDMENPLASLIVSQPSQIQPLQFGAKKTGSAQDSKDTSGSDEHSTSVPSDIYDYLEKIDRDEEESDEQVCGHVTMCDCHKDS